MGQKVHPYAFRLGFIRTWPSRWFSTKKYTEFLHKDIAIRRYITKVLPDAGIAVVEIARSGGAAQVVIQTSKPGIVIGRSGANIDKIRTDLAKKLQEPIDIKVEEIRKAETYAKLVAESIARQVERRISYRRAARMSMMRAREMGAQGIKIIIAGRLNGAEIAREETFTDGKIPLHTLRADIDYAHDMARTTYGAIGVKVWIFRGLVFETDLQPSSTSQQNA